MTHSLVKAREHIARMQTATRRAREKAGEVVESVITLAETGGTGFVLGYWHGKTDSDPKKFAVAGVPIPLAGGLAAHVFALLGVGRGMEGHLRAIGNGALTSHLFAVGNAMGKKSGGVSGDERLIGSGPVRMGAGITADDLAAYARQAA